MVLSELRAGQSATIVSMQEMEPIMRKKLLNLGFLPKAKVELLRLAPMGDPVVIRCASSSIALRKVVLGHIQVELSA
ncbi:ferrous iron transport protein A [Psychromonas sp. psych-6C06]|uniref:FeoA family protein n=1 Tax=Psychromonas sp. psych-6C06 TaxID=2058089 RepID=UPI000C3319BF|nr:FeoA family protein [Psychromonas sp. psych-6C06]PKF63461.1 ferrous iron transport protein A [Psychromonas sp. psych-6C06]